jgi:hypothetical protein
MHDLCSKHALVENLDDLDQQRSGRLHASFIQQIDKAVTVLQPIKPNARPGRQTVLPNVVVLDLESVRNRLLAPGPRLWTGAMGRSGQIANRAMHA